MKIKFSNFLAAICATFFISSTLLNAQETPKRKEGKKKDASARLLAKFDVNHNGVIDPDEQAAIDKAKAERIAKYDTNGDGKLDKDEKAAMKAAKGDKKKGTPGAPSPTPAATTGTSSAQ